MIKRIVICSVLATAIVILILEISPNKDNAVINKSAYPLYKFVGSNTIKIRDNTGRIMSTVPPAAINNDEKIISKLDSIIKILNKKR